MSGVVMYGMGPTWIPDPITPLPGPVLPDATKPFPFPFGGREIVVGPTAPETAEEVARRIDERIMWLERELSMHEAWKAELETLRRMRGIAPKVKPKPKRSARKKGGVGT